MCDVVIEFLIDRKKTALFHCYALSCKEANIQVLSGDILPTLSVS